MVVVVWIHELVSIMFVAYTCAHTHAHTHTHTWKQDQELCHGSTPLSPTATLTSSICSPFPPLFLSGNYNQNNNESAFSVDGLCKNEFCLEEPLSPDRWGVVVASYTIVSVVSGGGSDDPKDYWRVYCAH